MASLFDIRDKAQQAEGRQPDGVQIQLQPAAGIGAAAAPAEQAAARRTLAPFTDIYGGRNYRAIYRAVCDYHERNNPPRLALEYWEKAAEDISATASRFDNDPFVFALLGAVYDELEREYKKLEATQTAEEYAF